MCDLEIGYTITLHFDGDDIESKPLYYLPGSYPVFMFEEGGIYDWYCWGKNSYGSFDFRHWRYDDKYKSPETSFTFSRVWF